MAVMFIMYRYWCRRRARVTLQDASTQTRLDPPEMPDTLYWAASNAPDLHWHTRASCRGLRNARLVRAHLGCDLCTGELER